MTFFSFVTGLYVMIFFMATVLMSLFIFMLSKFVTTKRFEFKQILVKTFLGAIAGLVISGFIAYLNFPELAENASAREKEMQMQHISAIRYLLLYVPLVCGFIFSFFPVAGKLFRNEKQ